MRARHKQVGRRRRFAAGTKLFDVDRPARRVCLLESGRVELSLGPDVILGHLGPGDVLGERCLLSRGGSRQAARVLEPARLRCFTRKELLDCVQRDRKFGMRLLRRLAARLEACEQAIGDFVRERAERRAALALRRLAPPRPGSGWVRLSYQPTNLELARMIGATRWRISYFLNRFERLGWLRRRDGWWLNLDGLESFLKGVGAKT